VTEIFTPLEWPIVSMLHGHSRQHRTIGSRRDQIRCIFMSLLISEMMSDSDKQSVTHNKHMN